MVEEYAGELGESDGEEREIDAADMEAEAERADQRACGAGGGDADRHAEPGRQSVMHEERGADIGAEPDIERMAERQEPGEAHHDVPGLADIGGDQDENEN